MARFWMAGLIVAAASPLLAQTAPAPAPMAPMTMGMAKTMNRAEVQAQVQTQFARRDANRDGFLTSEEMTARGGQRQAGLNRRQMRQPGAQAQAMRDPNAAFDRLDANRDGAISRAEFAQGREVRMERRIVANAPGQAGAMERPNRRGMRAMRGGGGMMGGAMLKMADSNRDGRVSLAEATAGALQQFDRMDSNRDGRVTPDERAAGRAAMKQMRRAG